MRDQWRVWLTRYAFVGFVVLACAWTWPMAAAIEHSTAWPLIGLFGPTFAAGTMLWLTEGEAGLRRLVEAFRWRWRLLIWLVLAVLLPVLLMVPVVGVAVISGAAFELGLVPVTSLSVVLALLVLGEEIGWRGYALRLLLERDSPLAASLVVGVAWALWHLPNFFLPGFPHEGMKFLPFTLLLLGYSVMMTWFWIKSGGSLWVAWVLHATLNLVALDAPRGAELIPRAFVYALIAMLLALGGTFWSRRRETLRLSPRPGSEPGGAQAPQPR